MFTKGNSRFVTLICGLVATSPVFAQSQLGNDIDGEAVSDFSGSSVSLSADGNRVAIGAPLNDGNGHGSGHVRVYAWSGTAWLRLGNDINGETAGDSSGGSISLSSDGELLAVGAKGNDGNGSASGHVRVYVWSDNKWIQLGEDIDGDATGDGSGSSISLSANGKRLAVGAPQIFYGADPSRSGYVGVYEWSGTAWLQLGANVYGETVNDFSGSAVSLSADGNRLAIGAQSNDGHGSDAGHVRVYEWSSSDWLQLGKDIDGSAAGDMFGASVSLSADGNQLAIGAPDQLGKGYVGVYEWSGTAWLQLGANVYGETVNDFSGSAVALSADAMRLAIGALGNDGNRSDSGHVRVYERSSTEWQQIGDDINGEELGDSSGSSLSLSADGNRLAVGAPNSDDHGSASGHVRVYEQLETQLRYKGLNIPLIKAAMSKRKEGN